MLEALVASILNRVLGNYVSNLNYDQLKIAIWNGEVNLQNLKLRKDALDKLRLPIDVVEGYLGELTLSIPWSNLKTKPVKVRIRNVYLLAAPKTDSSVSLKDEEERAQQLKQRKLETAELLEASQKDTKTKNDESSSNSGFVSQLTAKVIDNIQLSLENIHLRYEDTVSCPDHPFAAGVTLKELSAISTNENWEPAFIGDLANTIHKLAKLESLSVYWNTDSSSLAGLPHEKASQKYTDLIPRADNTLKEHQYIVKPVSGAGKIKLNKSYGKEKAKVDTTLIFDELAFGLDDEQYRDALLLVDLFHSNLKKQEYLKFHPPHGTTPISDPKAYLQFAGQAVLSKIHKRNYKWTWDHFKKRRDQRLAYIDSYSAHKRGNATAQQNKSLADLEWALSFEDIRFYRSIAKSRLRKEKIRIDEAKKKNANKGWFSSWWGGDTDTTPNGDGSVDNDGDSMVLTEQQKKELYDAIDYDEDKAAIESAVDMPKDTMKFVLSTKLNRGSFRLLQHPHTTKHQVTSIVFETVGIEVIQYTDSMKISASLGDLQLYDGSTKDTLYPQLIGVKKESGKGTLSLISSNHRCHEHSDRSDDDNEQIQLTQQKPFLSITYQRKPLDKKADQAVKVVMRHLEIIYNPTTIQGVVAFFNAPSANSESFDALIEVAGDTLEGFKQQTRAGLEYALENHSTLDLDVDMDAPIIIIPENCLEEDSPVMIIDAGHIRVDSDLANQELAEEFKANTEKEFGPEDYKRLEGLMYDKFNVELSQIKLLIGRHVRKCIAQLEMDGADDIDGGGDAHVLHRIDMNLLVERCILPGVSQFTKIKVNGQLPLVSVNFSTQKYKTLMKIIDLVLPPSDGDATDDIIDGNQQLDTNDSQQRRQQQHQQSQKNLFAQQLWGDEEQHDLLLPDDTSSIYSDNHDNKNNISGAKRSFTDSSNSSGASNTEIARAQQNQLKLDFSIGHVSALIYESASCSTSKDTLLCELILEQFGLEFINRTYDMYVHVRLQALNVLDKMEHGNEYRYLVTSNDVMDDSDSQKDLVDVKYQRVNPKHPLFEEKFDGYDQTVDVLLSTLTFVVTRHSVLTLYNWIMTTFTGDDQQQQLQPRGLLGVDNTVDDRSSLQSNRLSLLSKGKQQAEQKQSQQIHPGSSSTAAEPPQDTGSIKVNVQMVGVQLILNQDGVRLGTGILSSGYVKVLLLPSRMMVMGKFGNFILTDDSSCAITANTNSLDMNDNAYYLQKISERSDVKMISIDDDELLGFTYSTLDPQSDDFPGYHQHLFLRLGAFRLLYVDALKPILDFLSEFLEMKNVYDSARTAATTMATSTNPKTQQQYATIMVEQQQQQQQLGEQEESLFCFDVVMQSPIVIFPVGVPKNKNVVVAHLGEIRASNDFVTSIRPNLLSGETAHVRVNQIKCGLYNISLYSKIYGDTKENGLPMLNDVDISVKIESAFSQNQDMVGPQTSIRGRISNVLMYLSEDQYKWLLEIENRLMTTFMGQPENGEKGEPTEPTTAAINPQQQELSSLASQHQNENLHTDNKSSNMADIQLDLCFDMELMCLEIYNGSEKDIIGREQHALCRLSFDDTSMKLQMMADGPMLIEVQMRSINFYDIRKNSTSRFKDILPAGKQLGGPQLQLQYKTGMKTDDGKDMTNVNVTLDRPQVVLSLDYLMLLKDFFATPFMAPPPPTEAQAFVVSQRVKDDEDLTTRQVGDRTGDTASHMSASASRPYSTHSQTGSHQTSNSANNQQMTSQSVFYYKINVVDLEIICLAHPEIPSSEAMVLSFEELSVIQQATFTLRLNGIGAMLCRMDKRTESVVPLVEPFDVGVDMQTMTPAPGYTNTNINARVQPITLRLSYHDFVLVMDIINKATALLGNDSYNNKNDGGLTTESSGEDDYDEELDNDLNDALTPESLLSSTGYSVVRNQYGDPHIRTGEQQKQPISQQQNAANRLIEPYIVMTRESMNALFEGFQLIVVEDLHDLPFMDLIVKPFTVAVSDWSRALTANINISTRFNYFNFKNSYWEPLIEPYNFEINVTQEPTTKSLDIGLSSKETLDINMTHSFLETLLSISSTLSDIQPLPENAQKRMKPFIIQNRTGYDLRFWNMSNDVEDGDTSVCFLKNGQDQDWTFRDWQKRKESVKVNNNLLGIEILHMGWESILHIPLDMEGKQSYRLKNGKDGIQHRVVVEIMLKNHVKTVIFHGGLTLDNQSEEIMQITMVDLSRRIVSPVWTIEPNALLYVPIGLSYRPWIVVRPSEHYHWSGVLLHWSDMIHPKPPSVISCKLLESDSPEFIYHLRGIFDTKNSVSRQYPIMKIQFGAPIKIVNHLPFDFKWTMMDQTTNQCISAVIKTGTSEQLHTFSSESDLAFVMDIQKDDYEPTELIKIQVTDSASQEGIPILVKDRSGNPIYLRLVLRRTKGAKSGLRIKAYAPYLILNKSAHAIVIRCRNTNYGYKAVTSVHDIPAYESQVTPYIFSYPKVDPKNRSEISIDGSKWSQALSFEAVGSSIDVCLAAQNNTEIHAGIHVEEGTGMYHLTKLVTISPRFVLKNDTHFNLKFAEFESNETSIIATSETLPLYMTKKSRSFKWLCLQLPELENQWSTPFDIQEIGATFIKIPRNGDSRPILIKASVRMKNATIFVILKHTTDWPYMIINCSSTDVTFYQEPCENDEHLKNKKSHIPTRKYHLTPEQKYMKYSWDRPATKERRLILEVGGKTRVIDFQAIGTQIPFRYKKHYNGPGGGILSIDIAARDSSLVLLLTDFKEENSLFRPTSSGESTIAASSSRESSSIRDHFETVDIELVVNYTFKLELKGIGISVVNSRSQEIIYATIKNLDVKYTDSNLYQSIRAGVQWLQIDNQLFGTTYPILFYPSTLPKTAPPGSNVHPTFHLALDKVKDNTHGVTYFKLFSVLFQEMTIEVDEDLLYALIEFAQFETKQNEYDTQSSPDLLDAKVEAPPEDDNQALLYFEEFCIQPMRLNLSFVRTLRVNTIDANESTNSPIGYIFDVFTMTIGNINDAPVKLNALIVENLRASSQDLSSRIMLHYQDQVIYQVHKVVGSADLIGNPVGLFNNLSSGFGELFYEPYQGFITSDRPQDLGIGIARGVGGFMKKSVFGFTDSFSRVTGSLGKGLAVATMDKKFQDRRRVQMTRNKPQHAIFGVTQGVSYFGTSIASGFAGLVKRPIEGAEESGVGGFFGGVGKGLVGVVTKPVVGLFDLASNVSAGIRETTNLFEAGALVRERLPRYIGKDGTIGIYSQREALGQMWMKEMKDGHYSQENYVAHTLADTEEKTAILTYQQLFMVHTRKLEIEWCEMLEDVESCKWIQGKNKNIMINTNGDNSNTYTDDDDDDEDDDDENDGGVLVIYTKTRPARTKTIHFMESTSGPWFTEQIQKTLDQLREEKSRQ